MNRRAFLFAAAVALGVSSQAAMADIESALVNRLRAEGFAAIQTERTWLGRVRISANGRLGQREIILNPRTGEVLRDIILTPDGRTIPTSLVEAADDNSGSNSGSGGNSGSGSGGNSGSGSGDDDSDDDSDDGDDDNSGSGSGSGSDDGDDGDDDHSGSGGGGDDSDDD